MLNFNNTVRAVKDIFVQQEGENSSILHKFLTNYLKYLRTFIRSFIAHLRPDFQACFLLNAQMSPYQYP